MTNDNLRSNHVIYRCLGVGPPPLRPGVCFGCGVPGHWRKKCPDKVQTHKMSTCLDYACFTSSLNYQCDHNICFQDVNVHSSKLSTHVSSPVGRLPRNVSEWIKIEKSSWLPSQSIIWLGYNWNFANATVSISDDRIQRLVTSLEHMIASLNIQQNINDAISSSGLDLVEKNIHLGDHMTHYLLKSKSDNTI
ncbi:hypothetical protein KUTeg_004240, partial [Tegillarca granosa]